MNSLAFWKQWKTPYRIFWAALSLICILSIVITWFYYFRDANNIIEWQQIQEQETIETTVHSFRMGPFELRVPAESYVIVEYLQGGEIHHNAIASYAFLVIIVLSALVLLTIISTLEGFWYFGGMSLFILFVVGLRLDVLYVFDVKGIYVPAVVIFIFIALSYFFKSIRSQASFFSRLITFASITVVLAILIYFYSTIEYPFLHLSVTAYIPGLILSIIFVVMVAHEIMAGFLLIASQGKNKSIQHFLVISTVYIANLIIAALHIVGYIHWNFIYLNPFLLLTVSAVLGLWGFRQRENLFENILPFAPFGAYFYAALAAICFATLMQQTGNDNDAALKVIGDISIFAHIGFGLAFVMYVFSNFMAMMAEGLSVNKVLYKPNRMPYFTFRLAGVVVTVAFMLVSYFRDYISNSLAGFYTYAADLYMLQGNQEYAYSFYDRSRRNSFQNHRSNYELGVLNGLAFEFEGADKFYEMANGKNASAFSLVNQGNLHLINQEYFDAIKIFHSFEKRDQSAALSNNLGFAYAKIHNLDSAIYYFSKARASDVTKSTAEGNFLAMSTLEIIPVKADSLVRFFKTDDPGVLANGLASATLFNQEFSQPVDPLKWDELDLYSATLLNNYIIHNVKKIDSTFARRALKIASDERNLDYSEALKSSLAYAFYHQGNVTKAYALLAEMAYLTQSYQGKYNYVSGLWALEQGSLESAQRYFGYADRADYKNARLYYAIALTESGSIDPAMVVWDSVKTYGDDDEKRMASNIQFILTMTPQAALTATDIQKYQYARYKINVNDSAYFSRFINTFENTDYKGRALLDMAKKQYKADRIEQAIRYFQQISGLELSDKLLYDEIRHFELRMLASRKEARSLANAINKGVTFDNSRFLEKLLYTAIINESSGDTVNAEKNYRLVATWNPYFEEGVLGAADFYRNHHPQTLKAYDVLAEAIQTNTTSLKLLRAYAAEALAKGFEDYAASANQRITEIEATYK